MLDLLTDLWAFMRERKKFWLALTWRIISTRTGFCNCTIYLYLILKKKNNTNENHQEFGFIGSQYAICFCDWRSG